ncbi:Uncharacterised protein [Vibrio cholerae]|nr:Uncharacterised protein [Vibrio cholerae]CSC58159.1 Uncharacterised protein [Vibrio cholerae]
MNRASLDSTSPMINVIGRKLSIAPTFTRRMGSAGIAFPRRAHIFYRPRT